MHISGGPFLEHIICGHEDPAAAVLAQHGEDGLSPSTSDLHVFEGRRGEHHCVGWEQQRITDTPRESLNGSQSRSLSLSWASTTAKQPAVSLALRPLFSLLQQPVWKLDSSLRCAAQHRISVAVKHVHMNMNLNAQNWENNLICTNCRGWDWR